MREGTKVGSRIGKRSGHCSTVTRKNATRCALCFVILSGGCFELGGGGQGSDASTGTPADPSSPIPQCDADRFEPLCVEGDLLFCSEDGEVIQRSCGDGDCVFGSDGADCLWPLNEPCDGEYSLCADPGGVHACVDGQWRFEPCPPGGRCVGDTCFGSDAVACDPGEQHCDGDARVLCNEDGFEVEIACSDGDVCQLTGSGPPCISTSAEPCDSESFVPQCDGDDRVLRCSDGWTVMLECGAGHRCFASDVDAACHDAGAQACDPTSNAPGCASNVATNCTTAGVWLETACTDREQCVLDQWCLPDCTDAAACIPIEAPPCDGRSGFFCDGSTLAYCFGGSTVVLSPDCGCVERDGRASCS